VAYLLCTVKRVKPASVLCFLLKPDLPTCNSESMKNLSLVALLFLLAVQPAFAQIPIVYYDCENNAARASFEVTPEMAVNSASSITYTTALGGCNTIGCPNAQGLLGAALALHGGATDGANVSASSWQAGAADPTTGGTSYYQFNVSTAGFNGISMTFDAKYGNANAPVGLGVLISATGGAGTWVFVGSTATTNGNTIPATPAATNSWISCNVNLTATSAAIANNNSTLYIRVYGWGGTATGAGAYLALDNITIMATSTVAGKVFTTLDENNYATGYSSGASSTALPRGSFTATGAGTNVTINNTSGLRMNAGQTFSVASSAAVTFGSTGVLNGTGIFNLASGTTLTTSNAGGIPSSVATSGANVFTAGANYNFNAATATPFPAGIGNPANVTINPGAGNSVTLNTSPTITGVLSFTAGKLAIGANTLTLGGTVSGMSGTNVLTGGASAGLSITGTGATGTLFMDQATDGTTNNISAFTLNRTASGTVTLGNKMVSGGSYTLTNGNVQLNGQTLVLNGTFSGSASGSLTGSSTSVLTIGGSGALGTLFFDQTTLGTTNAVSSLTLNRASSGIATLGNAISIGAGGLNLTNGTLADGGNIITLAGSITGTGAHSGSGKISMTAGGSAISSVSLGNLELNNAGGFSLSGSPSIGGTLTFVSGKLTIGSNNLVLGLASAIAGTPSASSMIVANSTGQVRKLFSANGSFQFPIGDNTNYSPITINFTGGTYALGAYCGATVRTVKHPSNANAGNYLNRYWPITTSGITSPNYSATAAVYVPGDVNGTEGNISMGAFTGSLPWVKFGVTNTLTHTLSSGAVTAINSDFTGITTAGPTVSSNANTAICVGGSVSLNATGGTGDPALTYTWAPATGLSATTGTAITATPAGTTTYTVTITDGNGFASTATTTITVNPAPSISGNTGAICTGAINILGGTPAGGTWISSDGTKATVGLSAGDVNGVAAGTATITYTASPGCVATTVVTVQPIPVAITGSSSVCTGSTTALGHPVSGGTWVSGDITKATVNSSGSVSGILAGTSIITYTLPSGCTVTTTVTVQPVPAAITGTASVCLGQTTALGHPVGGGTWVSSNPAGAPINSSGVVSGNTVGTATITYTVPVGCTTTRVVTVNAPPAAIGGTAIVCEGAATTLTDADAGGTWGCFPTSTAGISSLGEVTGVAAGNATVIYTLPTGCSTSRVVTVNLSPTPISGIPEVCVNSFITLGSSPSGGTWSSSVPATANVNSSGVVNGNAAGNTVVYYTLGNGCYRQVTVTVDALPQPITGDMEICVGETSALSSLSGGGTWDNDMPSVATVGSSSGSLTGNLAGTATISYTLSTGCRITAIATVDALPAAITGVNEVCVNSNTTLSDFTTGGTWSSVSTGIATVNGISGVVTGVSNGVSDIVYTLPTGCTATIQVSVDPLPEALTGNAQVCHGSTTTLSSTSGGGTWQSDNTAVGTVDGSGNVGGVSPGTATITYTLGTGCATARQVTVMALPPAITGPTNVCVNSTVALANTDVGGTWSSADGTVIVSTGTGATTGVSQGNATVTYTALTGCIATYAVTVNPQPAAPGGVSVVCEAGSITLNDADAGGTWSSPDATVTVGATTGTVTGVTAGTAAISYTIANGCSISKQVTVNPLPAPISGPTQLCDGQSAVYTTTSSSINWSSSNISVVTIDAGGVATALTTFAVNIICQFISTGCSRSLAVSVNALPAAVTGMVPVCENQSTLLSDATSGGTWSSSVPATASVNSSGMLTGHVAGNATITYTSSQGCIATAQATVNPVPAAITGTPVVCKGLTTDLDNTTLGGSWSTGLAATATADVNGLVTGNAAGITNVSYTLSTGCYSTVTLTVNQLPTAITGNLQVCQGLTSTLGSTPAGGTWVSNTTSVAGIGITNGTVSAASVGTTDITYTLPTGCIVSATATVNPLPAAITGTTVVCKGLSTLLSDADAGGTWSTASAAIATADALGNITGVAAGTTRVTYTLPTSCISTILYTVRPVPTAFTGTTHVCEGLTTNLGNALTGGTWTSGTTAVATITTVGVMHGEAAGTADITYTLPTGCLRTEVATVNPAVPAIGGSGSICLGLTTALTNASSGGVWISENTTVATADLFSGVVTGAHTGTSRITYALPTGCLNTIIATVNPLPATITGTFNVCAGLTTTLHDATAGGSWSGGTTGIALIDAAGVVSGTSAGFAPFTYMLPTGCIRTTNVAVNPLPVDQTITGGGPYCAGGTGVHVGLVTGEPTITYRLYRGVSVVAIATGAGAPLDFGVFSVAGTYTVRATAPGTNCVSGMPGGTTVSITPTVVPVVTMSSDHGDTVCNGVASTYSATPTYGGTSPTYEWMVNGSSMGTGSTYMYTPADGDSVKVKLTSSETCALPTDAVSTKRVAVLANQTPVVTATSAEGDSVCNGLPVVFHATSVWGGSAPVYTWRKNGADVATGTDYSYTPANGDIVLCRMTSNYICKTAATVSSTTHTLHVDSVYVPNVTIGVAPALEVRPNTVCTLTALVTGAGPSPTYEWKLNGATIAGATSPVLTSIFGDNDVVTCMVYGSGPCGLPSFNIVTMTVNGDPETGVGHTGVMAGGIRLVPNPNTGKFTIEGAINSAVSIEVTNMLGQVVYSANAAAANGLLHEQIDLGHDLADGMYMLNVVSGSGRQTVHFVVKK